MSKNNYNKQNISKANVVTEEPKVEEAVVETKEETETVEMVDTVESVEESKSEDTVTETVVEPKVEEAVVETEEETETVSENKVVTKSPSVKPITVSDNELVNMMRKRYKLKDTVKTSVTGTVIPDFAVKNEYKIINVLEDRVVIKAGTYSIAVHMEDIEEV